MGGAHALNTPPDPYEGKGPPQYDQYTGELLALGKGGKNGGGNGSYGKEGTWPQYRTPYPNLGKDGSKGKGKEGKLGKGGEKIPNPFYGTCEECGTIGHKKAQCPKLGKGFKGVCFGC